MAKRYQRLFELPGGLCAPGAPVLILAGALLLDSRSRNVLLQLKFYNLSPKTVCALTVSVRSPELPGQELEYAYSRLRAGQDETFGQSTAQVLPSQAVRSFSARVSRVEFDDGSEWEDDGAQWESFPRPQTLEAAYGPELAAQFSTRYGADCVYVPQRLGRYWQCPCGVLNSQAEKNCHSCQRAALAFLSLDIGALRAASEAADSAGGQDAPQSAPVKKRRPSAALWIVPLFLLGLFLIAVIIRYSPRVLNRIVTIPLPTPVPTVAVETPPVYTPSPTIEITPPPTLSPAQMRMQDYESAQELLDAQRYSEARAAFLALGGFEDSAELAQEAVYRKAVALLGFIREQDERNIYALLSMDARGTNRFSLPKDTALTLGTDVITALRSACGGDRVDISFSDKPSGTLRPLAACVKDLFLLLEDYRDSEACLEELAKLTDYTRDFYMLCEAGDIFGAYDWLLAYEGEFAGKDHWLQLLDLYKPYCGDWSDGTGDFTLLPLTIGHNINCYSFNSRVVIEGETALLRLRFTEGDSEFDVDLSAEVGAISFRLEQHGVFYFAEINNAGHFAYLKYYDNGIMSSVEYLRAA